jgi:hypothetical protein
MATDCDLRPVPEWVRRPSAGDGGWEISGTSAQEQIQLAEFWWRNELAVAGALSPKPEVTSA